MWLFHSVCFCLTLGVLSCCPRVCLCRPLPERWRCGASPALCDGRRRVWSVRPLRAWRRRGPFRLLSFLPLRLLRAVPPPGLRGLPLRPLGRGGPLSPSHCPVPGRSPLRSCPVVLRLPSFRLFFDKDRGEISGVYCIFAIYHCIISLYVEGKLISPGGNIDS